MFALQEGAFDEAVKDVDAIEHTASPFHYNVDDPQGTSFLSIRFCWALTSMTELIDPAVNGTVSILKSTVKYGQVSADRLFLLFWRVPAKTVNE
jgi:hypothetical protein